ncbi:MAG TPA: hypothetical protein VFB50_09375, partial [Chloroflexota bacterium]|nr:hypothetical protein [Chloroflexota bacterium]
MSKAERESAAASLTRDRFRLSQLGDELREAQGRASGGPVSAGRTYWVGERGPELFHAGTDGWITPRATGGGVRALGKRQLEKQLLEAATTLKPSLALRELFTYYPRGQIGLVQPAALGYRPGQELPSYAKPLDEFLQHQGRVLAAGALTPEQVATAYITTLSSIRGRAAPATNVFRRLSQEIPQVISRGTGGRKVVRPEDLVGHYLGTEEGLHALAGTPARLHAHLQALGARSGFTFPRIQEAFRDPGVGEYTLRNIDEATRALNDAGRRGASESEMAAILGRFQGIGLGKTGFLGQWIGYGRLPTVDTNVLQKWLGGERVGQVAQRAFATPGLALGQRVRSLISGRYDDMRRMGVFPGVSEATYRAVAHHVTFTSGAGSEATHQPIIDTLKSQGRALAEGGLAGTGAYLVGEQGPELFVPEHAGTVLPNHEVVRLAQRYRGLGEPGNRRQRGGAVYPGPIPYGTGRAPFGAAFNVPGVPTPIFIPDQRQAQAIARAVEQQGRLNALLAQSASYYERLGRSAEEAATAEIRAAEEVLQIRQRSTQAYIQAESRRVEVETARREARGPRIDIGGQTREITPQNEQLLRDQYATRMASQQRE